MKYHPSSLFSASPLPGVVAAERRVRLIHWLRRLWLILPFLIGGCAVSFVSPYDELTNAAIHDAAIKAETIFAKVTVNKEPYSKLREDYREMDGKLAVIAMRSASYGKKNEAEQKVVSLFQQEMAELEAFHRDVAPYRASQLAGARSILRSLVHHQKGKKAAIGSQSGGDTP